MDGLLTNLTPPDKKIVFKSLIVAHIIIRDGARDVALRYLAEQPRYFTVSHISQGPPLPVLFGLFWLLTRMG